MAHDTRPIDRRTALRAGAAPLAAIAGVSSIAGCLDDAGPTSADEEDAQPSEDADVVVEEVVTGLSAPWGIAFLPESTEAVVTERDGDLLLVDVAEGESRVIANAPTALSAGQGGLLDVALHPEYASESWVYLTYAVANGDGESTTAVGRGRLDRDGGEPALDSFEQLHAAEPYVDSTGHYGSRATFGPDGALYVTVGDRQFKDFGTDHVSQDTTTELGTTLRLDPDGTVPDDNPFLDDEDVLDTIYSSGHRNAQGMTVHPETAEIWQSEHGEEDGDEINVIEAGGNYGWPVAHTGCAYGTDDPVGDHPEDREDVVDPVYYWECGSGGFPPAGATFYDGDAVPAWEGDLFVGNLAGQYLGRFAVDGHEVTELDPLLADRGWRVRDVTVGPDDALYVLVDGASAPVVRIGPEDASS